ncbi:polysaccharide export protein [Lysobacter sp. H21R4]|uniref:polysaccharide biosynthesis/export family protein n=1 Tax=Lysobacter sp. H21R4 TaxID=2781021 RepID=UPI001887D605|nr:polysaccharide biosynthesis/export family protein [Lysobacter sp. H21R4]QOY62019.1 polysaccharide export protein [Lysobacter sp. H21R4]
MTRFAALACALLLSACASRGPGASGAVDVLPQGDPVAEAVGRPEYRIGPSDLLTVTVFQVEDLDREIRVNNSGQVSLPLIGVINVAGMTVTEMEGDVARRYAASYLQNPQVSIFVKEFSSQRVTVSGSVAKPGIYPIASQVTLLQALALAEGLDPVASHKNVLVFRTVGGVRHFARFDVDQIIGGKLNDPVLQGEDIVVVDTSTGKVALQNLIKLAPFVAVWRAYR